MGSEYLKDGVLQLVRSFGTKLSHVAAAFFDRMHSSTFGAVVGFAIAFVWTWKYLKAPRNQQKRIEKHGETPETVIADTSTRVALHHTQPAQRSVITHEPEVSNQLALNQIVKRQLNGGRKMTCQLLGVILEESTPEELQEHAVVRPEVINVLSKLVRNCDLYLMARVLDDESEARAMAALEAVDLFSRGGLNRNKVLFCSTEAGRCSFVRQLEPDWHVDTSVETISQLARFIPKELYISSKGTTGLSDGNVVGSESLEGYFGQLNHN